ncbi:MAG: Asp-tRNA(Asn)/Glu-tRNA(Gln) amidotransferase subunit GatC [Candidatus Sungbacteria bacterium]|nr:Asp-tRNA(Asn)/Glu-tRNA(Gln) amidotransferase subunit GatC [Candidatus Sungbacteria bacterium]
MITKEDVQHIAHLARIELTPEEEERFQHDLSAILQFVEQLNQVDTTGIEPMTGGTHLEQITRMDAQINTDLEHRSAGLIEATSEKRGQMVSVKSVFE